MRRSSTCVPIAMHNGRYALVAAVVLVLAGVLAWGGLSAPVAEAPVATSTAARADTGSTTPYTLAAAAPTRLRIPAIDLEAPFGAPLGLMESEEVEVPASFEEVGWYRYSPTPGELGPAVVLGHVDSYRGPAIFWSLRNLTPGDEIIVEREDGTHATFTVTTLESYDQADFPTAQVYGDLDHAGLRLITCSGVYDRGTQRYTHNLVVYARLVDPAAPSD